MKKIIFSLIILLLISCKKENEFESIQSSKSDTITKNEINLLPFGDELISKNDFVNQIVNGESVKAKRKKLSEINFDYNAFNKWRPDAVEKKNIGDIILQFKRENNADSKADIYTYISLTTFKNDKKIDKIIVYKNENYSEALVAVSQLFYIDLNLNLWVLGINEDEGGINLGSWNQYKINKKSGRIDLVKRNIISYPINKYNIGNTNLWKGKYFFEKEDLNDLKTSFDITINSLDDISIIYVSKEGIPKTYKNLVAKMESNDKIKIVFNDENLGSIYIQSNEGEYTILGNVISNLNPGNDEYYLKKK
ncbi:hypothetical protein NYQ10_11980 [Flavobacterium johnsoniae]|uniref:hypothetical protein n=1 Tax=Flavobacterium johnsoniae TaxID=986 RepID=UPI0025AF3839|nr:hypothetical protein [Flavobacterium johnsoniae]WJS92804.1 hypothetical protein NYQ10_11980 [Flavobacterium johnsoniae]